MNIVKYAVAVLVLTSASGIAQMEPPKPERNSVKEGKEQPKHERMGERKGMEARGDRMEMLLEQLSNNQKLMEETGITEEQITKIKDSLDEIKKKLIDLRGEMEKAGMDQAKLISAREMDEGAIMKAIEKLGGLKTETAKLEIQRMLVIKKNLKPEQLEKLKKSIQEKAKEHRQRMNEEKRKMHKGDSENEKNPPRPPEDVEQ